MKKHDLKNQNFWVLIFTNHWDEEKKLQEQNSVNGDIEIVSTFCKFWKIYESRKI